jgi:hypothetical protein
MMARAMELLRNRWAIVAIAVPILSGLTGTAVLRGHEYRELIKALTTEKNAEKVKAEALLHENTVLRDRLHVQTQEAILYSDLHDRVQVMEQRPPWDNAVLVGIGAVALATIQALR